MPDPSWTDAVSAVASVATPLVVAAFGTLIARRQSRNQELLKARIDYYKTLIPDLNTLMCYMTFIGTWRDQSPLEILVLKRRLDQHLYCAAPLFSSAVLDAYVKFEKDCFRTFNSWGEDALIKSGAFRRRQAWTGSAGWDPAWDAMFTNRDEEAIPSNTLTGIRKSYDQVVATIVKDLSLTRTRSQYTTDLVSLNAHAPIQQGPVGGAGDGPKRNF